MYRALSPTAGFRTREGQFTQTRAKALFMLRNETEPRRGLKHQPTLPEPVCWHTRALACANRRFPSQRLSTLLGKAGAVPGTDPAGCWDAVAPFWGAEVEKEFSWAGHFSQRSPVECNTAAAARESH